jgi:NTE family protein
MADEDDPGTESKADPDALPQHAPGPALCLSGGGFRATLFHLGALRRLNELGVLARIEVITSVSGASILNGVLATRWPRLLLGPDGAFTNFEEEVARPIRNFCGRDLRTPLLLGTRVDLSNLVALIRDFFSVSANYLAESYEPLFRQRLCELPAPGPQAPRFVFCATNVKTGACWHFHSGPQGRMGDFYVGYCNTGSVRVSEAVAASSAFTPGFSALRLKPAADSAFSRVDPWGQTRPMSAKRGDEDHGDTSLPILLTDGGVYDNLGVEPVWNRYSTILSSDAGRPFQSVSASSQWIVARLRRAVDISTNQVGGIRRRWLFDELSNGRRQGALWTIHTLIEAYPHRHSQGYGEPFRRTLWKIRTDLNAFTPGEIACLENHGYSLADAAICSHVSELCTNLGAPFQWPHPAWLEEEKCRVALSRSHRRDVMWDLLKLILRFGRP